jgi:hypothetical protein
MKFFLGIVGVAAILLGAIFWHVSSPNPPVKKVLAQSPPPSCMIPNSLGDTTTELIDDTEPVQVWHLQQEIVNVGFDNDMIVDQKQYQSWNTPNGSFQLQATWFGREPEPAYVPGDDFRVYGYFKNGNLSNFVPLFKIHPETDYPSIPYLTVGQSTVATISNNASITFGGVLYHPLGGGSPYAYISTENSQNLGGIDAFVVYDAFTSTTALPEDHLFGMESNILDGDFNYDNGFFRVRALTSCAPPPTSAPTPTSIPTPTPTPVGAYTIRGNVYVDANRNTVKDTGEANYGSGTTISLSGQASRTATSDGAGNYVFSGLYAGNYTVGLTLPGGHTNTTPITNNITFP